MERPRPQVRSAAWLLALALACLAGCPDDPPEPRVPTYTLRLVEVGDDRAGVVAAVRSITGYAPKIAEALVDRAPVPVKTGLDEATARQGAADLEAAGARALVSKAP